MDSKTHSIDRFYSTDLLHHQSTSNRKMLAEIFYLKEFGGIIVHT
jgi:hypothetical protein